MYISLKRIVIRLNCILLEKLKYLRKLMLFFTLYNITKNIFEIKTSVFVL